MLRQSFIGLISLIIFALSGLEAKAKIKGQCGTFRPRIGDGCYQDVYVRARSGYPGSQTGRSQSTSFAGWYIVGYDRPVDQGSFGEISGPNVQYVKGGSNFDIRNSVNSNNRQLLDVRNRLKAKASVPVEGVPVNIEGLVDSINRTLRDNQSRLESYSRAVSNVDFVDVIVTVAGRCTRHVLNVCVDNQGGKYEGYVRVYMIYVGTPNEIASSTQAIINRANDALNRIRQAEGRNPPPQPPVRPNDSKDPAQNRRNRWEARDNRGTTTFVEILPGKWEGNIYDVRFSLTETRRTPDYVELYHASSDLYIHLRDRGFCFKNPGNPNWQCGSNGQWIW
ncbi:MAG: hypothetical protein GPJ18_20140 [Microcystis aeruginosa F13-15]|jgi:hypothetical protein|nr:hypothetical protein [Microcystis aeruginosa LG13-12]NCS30725.1 hypothetical protein [Microcystis aeruginosa F13-15]